MAESRTTVTVRLLEGRRELRPSGRIEGERAEEGGEREGRGERNRVFKRRNFQDNFLMSFLKKCVRELICSVFIWIIRIIKIDSVLVENSYLCAIFFPEPLLLSWL